MAVEAASEEFIILAHRNFTFDKGSIFKKKHLVEKNIFGSLVWEEKCWLNDAHWEVSSNEGGMSEDTF